MAAVVHISSFKICSCGGVVFAGTLMSALTLLTVMSLMNMFFGSVMLFQVFKHLLDVDVLF